MRKISKSLRGRVLAGAILLLLIMAAVIVGVGYRVVSSSLTKQAGEDLKKDCDLLESLLGTDSFTVKADEEGKLYLFAGDENLTKKLPASVEKLHDSLGLDVSIFYQDVRVLTTLLDENKEPCVQSVASPVLVRDVLEQKEESFYEKLDIFGEEMFVYYRPIIQADGSVFGMIGIGQSAGDIRSEILAALLPLILICLFSIVVLGGISVYFASVIMGKVVALSRFTKGVAEGRFTENLSEKLLKEQDELGDLARGSVSMQRSIRTLVEKDALTGLNNRRYAGVHLEQFRKRLEESGVGFWICICDIDFFKKVNDSYGHDNGDLVLKAVSKILQNRMVGQGFSARWGGEEFLLIFDALKAKNPMSVLQAALDEIRALTIYSEPYEIRVTMSFGLSKAAAGESIDVILKRADECLYYAKEHGRNQIVSADKELTGVSENDLPKEIAGKENQVQLSEEEKAERAKIAKDEEELLALQEIAEQMRKHE